ncbi:flagellar hook-associated protein FlgL [uncultured Clostridium sp.]|uniref:flagellar hook-associated protein FlgL n=1 Tax=uncultured Clostridium sp. TaxID=59620 RepID=UPI00267171A9|nr:flagellar hook-associated protein FlgL [uncultured Clostridium sp.]
MIINHNMNALNAHRNMGINNTAAGKSMEKLSSGLRINRAGDDAAGLAISEKMRGQIRGLTQASRNSADGISMIQTAEGALNETTNILQRMRELAVQASNDTNTTSDREEIQKEINALTEEVDRIANNTEFNTQKLLNGSKSGEAGDLVREEVKGVQGEFKINLNEELKDGDRLVIDGKIIKFDTQAVADENTIKGALEKELEGYEFTVEQDKKTITLKQKVGKDKDEFKVSLNGAEKGVTTNIKKDGVTARAEEFSEGKVSVQVGANADQSMSIEIGDMRAQALKIVNDKGRGLSVETAQSANEAITAFDAALNAVSSQRANLGAVQNRLEYTISNLDNTAENLTSAESTLRDVDMAKEMMEYSKNNILNQAAQAMISQANQQPQNVLQLLR